MRAEYQSPELKRRMFQTEWNGRGEVSVGGPREESTVNVEKDWKKKTKKKRSASVAEAGRVETWAEERVPGFPPGGQGTNPKEARPCRWFRWITRRTAAKLHSRDLILHRLYLLRSAAVSGRVAANVPKVPYCLFCLPFVIATALSSEGFPLPERSPPTRKSGRRALLPPHTLPYRSKYRHRARPRQERYPTLAHIRRRERTTRGYLSSKFIVSSSGQSPQGKKRCGVSSRHLQFDSSEPHISIPSPGPRPSTRRGLDPNRTPFHHHNSFPLTTHETQPNTTYFLPSSPI
ncbi:hypothetical protein CNYM01_02354 [Colletotrichum nymphaeae SA-01]|uniref:Uncharacterized protein n=1 Tax=Colletotrichum nymphaeae SA-01 TaxID=1460502 RepID=A0A135UNT5_9PEZI|nr:hypothetical protein CNYM01_02354 [Colletotrichum nymphaeae SA-01]